MAKEQSQIRERQRTNLKEPRRYKVHHSDKAVVGIYSYDIAVSKARKATNMAREQGFPLRLTVEPEES